MNTFLLPIRVQNRVRANAGREKRQFGRSGESPVAERRAAARREGSINLHFSELRRRKDSNLRTGFPVNALAVRSFRPLRHASIRFYTN